MQFCTAPQSTSFTNKDDQGSGFISRAQFLALFILPVDDFRKQNSILGRFVDLAITTGVAACITASPRTV